MKTQYVEIDFCWKYWNAKWKCSIFVPGSACLPSQLPAQLPSSSLGRCRTSVLQSACKSTFWFQNTRKCHSKSCLFLLKQIYSFCQSKANGDCRSQGEIQTSGLTSSQSKTRKFIKKKRYDTFPWTHRTAESSPGFYGIQGLLVSLLPKGTGRPPTAQVGSPAHDCFCSGCTRPCRALVECSVTQISLNAAISFGGKLHYARRSLGAHFPAGKCKWTSCGARRKCPASILSRPIDMAGFHHFAAGGGWGCRSPQDSPDLWHRTL